MPFVQAKCENCGGVLQVDSNKKAAICPYCNTPYVVQDAINHYITNIGNLHADVVNVNSDGSAQSRLVAAETFMKLAKYSEARKAFEDVSSLTPQDYRGWWGQIRAITKEFSVALQSKSELEKIYALYTSTQIVAPENEKTAIERKFFSYYNPLAAQISKKYDELQKEIQLLNEENKLLTKKIDKMSPSIAQWEGSSITDNNGCLKNIIDIILVITVIVGLISGNIVIAILGCIPRPIGFIFRTIKDEKYERLRYERSILEKRREKVQNKLLQLQQDIKRIS